MAQLLVEYPQSRNTGFDNPLRAAPTACCATET